ncbi:MAG TPA: phosphoserine phosphatase SerB [Burkholderiales bacterium]|nr:phosphoserine phosphatase SerB [Burkholderiales bacterium]
MIQATAPSAPTLVVQSLEAAAAEAAAIADLCGSDVPEPLGAHAFRLRGAQRRERVAAWCETRRLDHGWVPDSPRFGDLKLVAMDMDSTLITIECIDELGGVVGRKEEISAITAQAMRGEIDYPESLRRRVALLAGMSESALEDVYEEKLRLSPGAEALIAACKNKGIALLLVSGGFSFFTERLRQRLGFDDTLSNVLEIDGGKLTGRVLGSIVDADAKAAKFRQLAQRLGAARAQTVAIGDGANDLKMMAEAGTSIAYRAKPVVRAKASYALNYSGLDGVINLFQER